LGTLLPCLRNAKAEATRVASASVCLPPHGSNVYGNSPIFIAAGCLHLLLIFTCFP
jgi:hypothetical protein